MEPHRDLDGREIWSLTAGCSLAKLMVLKQCFAQPTGAVAGSKLLLGLRLVMKQLPVQLRGCKGGYRCSEFQQHVLELKLRCSWYSEVGLARNSGMIGGCT